MKLNLGCGHEHLPGWVNVDKFAAARPDVVHDLERFPWPFQEGAAEEVLLKHVLEHLGRDGDTFLNILKELYRVCAPGGKVRIIVPHPRHQDFLQDPTHVRPVLAEMFEHFSLDCNEDWARRGLPGTPLAKYLGLDFKVESVVQNLDPRWDAELRAGRISREQLERAMRDHNNVVQTTEIVLAAQKPFRGVAAASAPAVRFEGSQFVYHSLAHVNRQLCLRLLGSGRVNLSLVPYEPDRFDGNAEPAFRPLAACVNKPLGGPAQVHVRHQWPPRFDAPEEGAWVMIQPWEYGGIPQEWIAPMRDQVDEIWVPTAWLKDCYVRSGIPEAKVVVVPNGVDGEVFKPEGEKFPLRTRKGCKFLFLGGTIRRKGIDVLLEAYLRAFRGHDDVCLVIKAQSGGVYGAEDLPAILARFRAEDPGGPEIEYRSDDLNEEQVAALYRSCDALVLPYRGEGFGLPIAEAMASGLPVIVTGRGAGMDFVRGDCAYLIPSRTITVQGPPGFTPGPAGFWLEEPDPAALADLLRQAYTDAAGRRERGRRAREHALAELGWARPAEIALERLEQLALRHPRRDAPPEPAQAPEAFVYRPDWASAEWAEVLMSYLLAFKAGEPVILVLPWAGTPGEPALAAIQDRVLQLAMGAGLERFPDVALVDEPDTLPELLGKCGRITEVPQGRGAVAGLDGPMGRRLAAARAQMAQG